MKAISETAMEKSHRRVYANNVVELVLRIPQGKLPNRKYTFSLLYIPSGDASVSMSVKKICTFALYEPEVNLVNIQAGIWCTMWTRNQMLRLKRSVFLLPRILPILMLDISSQYVPPIGKLLFIQYGV